MSGTRYHINLGIEPEELGVQVHYEEEFRTPSGLIINTDMTLLIPFAIDLKYHEHLGRMGKWISSSCVNR